MSSFKQENGYCVGGLSSEINFVRHNTDFFRGWINKGDYCKENTIVETLKYIKKTENSNTGSVVISPGLPTSLYLAYCTNSSYLPSQFLVRVKEISELKKSLDYANSAGYDCYCILGYDYVMPECIVGWIKFRKNPYRDILKGRKVYSVLCFDPLETAGSENIVNHYSDNIYLSFIHQFYNNDSFVDYKLYKDYITDFEMEKVGKRVKFNDWESGLDDPLTFFEEGATLIYSKDTFHLYNLVTYLAEYFYTKNNIIPKTVIVNPYGILNPSNEFENECIPIVYWYQCIGLYKKFIDERIDKVETIRFIKHDSVKYESSKHISFLNYTDDTNKLFDYIQTVYPRNNKEYKFFKKCDLELLCNHLERINIITL